MGEFRHLVLGWWGKFWLLAGVEATEVLPTHLGLAEDGEQSQACTGVKEGVRGREREVETLPSSISGPWG